MPLVLLLPAVVTTTFDNVVSPKCSQLGSTDGVLFVDPQNCFMEKRPAAQSGVTPAYPIPGSATDGSSITDGPLRVLGSAEIIPVMNSWASLAHASGAHSLLSLDYHPPQHCSFCYTASSPYNTSSPSGISAGSACLSGAFTEANDGLGVNFKCNDSISLRDRTITNYWQWPEHCVAGTFGARLDPYLQLPSETTVVKLGVSQFQDSYSAFDGGRISSAERARTTIRRLRGTTCDRQGRRSRRSSRSARSAASSSWGSQPTMS